MQILTILGAVCFPPAVTFLLSRLDFIFQYGYLPEVWAVEGLLLLFGWGMLGRWFARCRKSGFWWLLLAHLPELLCFLPYLLRKVFRFSVVYDFLVRLPVAGTLMQAGLSALEFAGMPVQYFISIHSMPLIGYLAGLALLMLAFLLGQKTCFRKKAPAKRRR